MKKHFTAALVAAGLLMSVAPIALAAAGEGMAYASTQAVLIDGSSVTFQAYALKDANGNDTNYIKIRDVAAALDGTAAQFNVGWDNAVNIETGKPYNTRNGQEGTTPYAGDRTYTKSASTTKINGTEISLDAITLTDDNGGGHTYYKLRDLGDAIGFNVDWSNEKGIFIETKGNHLVNYSLGYPCYDEYKDVPSFAEFRKDSILETHSYGDWYGYVLDSSDKTCEDEYGSLLNQLGYRATNTLTHAGSGMNFATTYQKNDTGTNLYVWHDEDLMARNGTRYNIVIIAINNGELFRMTDEMKSKAGTLMPDSVTMYPAHKDVPDYGAFTGDPLIFSDGDALVYESPSSFTMPKYKSQLKLDGFEEIESYDSGLTSTPVQVFTNSAGTVLHIWPYTLTPGVNRDGTRDPSHDYVIMSLNSNLDSMRIRQLLNETFEEINPLSDPTSPYKNDSSNYLYGYLGSPDRAPIYVQKANVATAADLRTFLQKKYSCLYSPMGELKLNLKMNIEQKYPDEPLFAHIAVDFYSKEFAPNQNSIGHAQTITPLNFTGVGFTRSQERETYEMLKQLQMDICQDIVDCFPTAEASGTIAETGYRYSSLKVGYWKKQTLTWNNYSGEFAWAPSADSFDLLQ